MLTAAAAAARAWMLAGPLLVSLATTAGAEVGAAGLPASPPRSLPESALATQAPTHYTVQPGDTLWRIAGLFLQQPWRWPALWGMNPERIHNPQLIYPGQQLVLERHNGYARLHIAPPGSGEGETLHLSPRSRADPPPQQALATLPPHLIAPFLAEPLVVSPEQLQAAPRLVATTDERVLMAQGDRVYARGDAHSPLRTADAPLQFRIFRDALALQDPVSSELLGYEAHYLGTAALVRSEQPNPEAAQSRTAPYLPATLELLRSKEEIRAGDRLLPEPARSFRSYTPHAPDFALEARVLKLYTSTALRYGAPQQVVAINKGLRDGLEMGHVLAVVAQGQRLRDQTSATQDWIQLPDEDNGAALVFLAFERVAYVLLMEGRYGVQVGDKMVTPQ
ncbi:LysM peptidoglycan-binding domain-containing protein [Comamonas sp. GB3 AK4-5]|uniref:LysM peptidoglycan-binding domain-containing protein n=1 Tax=Comamonas sp. GB3 AK4-5 TaxID=3231487 RepID=UPI00351F1833